MGVRGGDGTGGRETGGLLQIAIRSQLDVAKKKREVSGPWGGERRGGEG